MLSALSTIHTPAEPFQREIWLSSVLSQRCGGGQEQHKGQREHSKGLCVFPGKEDGKDENRQFPKQGSLVLYDG